MGARHVSAVYAQWRHLPDRPFRLLCYMALIAKDATPEPTYWGGRDGLCIALGLDHDDSGYRIARRAVADLEAAGALTRQYVGHAGKRSEYRVMVTPKKEDSTVLQPDGPEPDQGGQDSPPKGGHLSPQRGTPESAKGDTTVPPRTTRNTRSESEEEISPSKVSPEGARDLDAKTDEISPFEASKILHEAGKQGVNIVALIDSAPPGLTTKTQRRAWAARQLLAKESA